MADAQAMEEDAQLALGQQQVTGSQAPVTQPVLGADPEAAAAAMKPSGAAAPAMLPNLPTLPSGMSVTLTNEQFQMLLRLNQNPQPQNPQQMARPTVPLPEFLGTQEDVQPFWLRLE